MGVDRIASLTERIEDGERARMQFGRALRVARRYVGLNQKETAELLGVSPKHLYLIEACRAWPSPELARRAQRKLTRLDDGSNHTHMAKQKERAGRRKEE